MCWQASRDASGQHPGLASDDAHQMHASFCKLLQPRPTPVQGGLRPCTLIEASQCGAWPEITSREPGRGRQVVKPTGNAGGFVRIWQSVPQAGRRTRSILATLRGATVIPLRILVLANRYGRAEVSEGGKQTQIAPAYGRLPSVNCMSRKRL